MEFPCIARQCLIRKVDATNSELTIIFRGKENQFADFYRFLVCGIVNPRKAKYRRRVSESEQKSLSVVRNEEILPKFVHFFCLHLDQKTAGLL
ncbi:hypothetical protein DMENIID0001_156350 [Sergentomyia squamirostris]